jgi:hypothetical protein
MSTPRTISLKGLTEQVEAGMKKNEIAEFYSLPISQVTALLKQAGLKIRKFHAKKFELIMDLEEDNVSLQSDNTGLSELELDIISREMPEGIDLVTSIETQENEIKEVLEEQQADTKITPEENQEDIW